jgi:hypothetical protein
MITWTIQPYFPLIFSYIFIVQNILQELGSTWDITFWVNKIASLQISCIHGKPCAYVYHEISRAEKCGAWTSTKWRSSVLPYLRLRRATQSCVRASRRKPRKLRPYQTLGNVRPGCAQDRAKIKKKSPGFLLGLSVAVSRALVLSGTASTARASSSS